MNLLLISNSGRPYLGHCKEQILQTLQGCKRVGFISAAYFGDEKEYFQKVVTALEGSSVEFVHVQTDSHPNKTLDQCDGLLVGGGNTYRLLQKIVGANLIGPIRKRVKNGMPYIGWSAGSNLAGPTILTTNDWNVVGLQQFEAFGLVPFNINPHYIETDPRMAPFSETRDERIAEYHKAQDNPVLGVEEQTMLLVQNGKVQVIGTGRVRKFEKNQKPCDFTNNQIIPF